MIYYKSARGEDVVLNSLNDLSKSNKTKVIRALEILDEDKFNTENILYTKPFRKPVIELKIGQVRVFYMYKNNDICILHLILKKSGKTDQNTIDLVLKRSKE